MYSHIIINIFYCFGKIFSILWFFKSFFTREVPPRETKSLNVQKEVGKNMWINYLQSTTCFTFKCLHFALFASADMSFKNMSIFYGMVSLRLEWFMNSIQLISHRIKTSRTLWWIWTMQLPLGILRVLNHMGDRNCDGKEKRKFKFCVKIMRNNKTKLKPVSLKIV